MTDTELLKTTFLKLLEEISPQKLVESGCSFDNDILKIQNRLYDLKKYNNIYLFGSGKAVLPMAETMQKILKERIKKSFLVGAYKQNINLKNTTYMQSSHPLPTQKSIDFTKKLILELDKLGKNDFFIYLLSGGTSALLELPEACISLEDIQKTTDIMLKNALPIEDINCIRKHISSIKGGKLGKHIKANGVVLVLSDVLDNNLQSIGSAPLYFDSTTFNDALSCLNSYGIFDAIPKNVKKFITEGIELKQKETLKDEHKNIKHFILGSNKIVLQKAKEILEKQIKTTIIDKPVKDEVNIETQRLLAFVKANSGERACFIFGAECTVKANKNGIGGRNQHLGLNFLDKFRSKATLLFAATDGVDGNSDAAGVVIETNSKSKDNSDAIRAYLRDFNSNLYFQKNKSLVVTGPTHNNLLDIIMMIL